MHPLVSRPHLEPLLIARVLLDPELADRVDDTRLSPAALALLDFAAAENTLARAALGYGATDEYQQRLAQRVGHLTLDELLFYPTDTLVGLINALPRIAARPVRSSA
jgi:hypothetical protein